MQGRWLPSLVVIASLLALLAFSVPQLSKLSVNPSTPATNPQLRLRLPPRARRHALARFTAQARTTTQIPTMKWAAISLGLCALTVLGGLGVISPWLRLRARKRRKYLLYEIHLSSHDEAKPQDLKDTIEAFASFVRCFPSEYWVTGQPFFAVELHYWWSDSDGWRWTPCVRCQQSAVNALDAELANAYPDVRIGHVFNEEPRPIAGQLDQPGHVMRFRKQREFIYSLIAQGEDEASPPIEQIARAQVNVGRPSTVRIQLTPTQIWMSELARHRYRRQENKLAREESWGTRERGVQSTINRDEMQLALGTQNQSLFWLELQVASESMAACKPIMAAVQARRGENWLRRRWLILRQPLYQHRFPNAYPPLLPWYRHALVSSHEIAHLAALPSTARMKGVPVARLAIPRVQAPPEVRRATEKSAVKLPAQPEQSNGAP